MAIAQEQQGRSIGGFMNRFQRQWDQQRAIDAQEEMRRQREMQAEAAGKKKPAGGSQDQKKTTSGEPSIPLVSSGASLSTIGAGGSERAMPSSGGGKYNLTSEQKAEMATAIRATAGQLGVDPNNLAAAMSFETGGTLNPWQPGPTTKYGQHMGLIQWGEPQRRQYGVSSNMSITDQVAAAGKYLRDRGVKPGMGLENIYAAILRGNARNVDRVTDKNGTSVISAAENMRRTGHAHALERLEGGVTTPAATRGSITPSSLRRNNEAGSTGPRAEALPRNQMAYSGATMNDASPSRAQETGGRVMTADTPAVDRLPTDPRNPAPEGYFWDLGGAGDRPRLISRATGQDMAGQPLPAAGAVTPPGAGAPSVVTPASTTPGSAPSPATETAQTAADVPLPPRRPDDLGQTAQPARQAQAAQQDDGIDGFFKDIGSFFSSEPIKDKSGREWDPLYGFEKPPEGGKSIVDTNPIEEIGSGALNFFSSLFA